MSTLEERVTFLENAIAALQKQVETLPNQGKRITNLEQKTNKSIQEIEENTIIMLSIIRSQGQDIRKIFEQLDTMGERFGQLETKVDEHTKVLYDHTSILHDNTRRVLNDYTKVLNDHTSLLTRILERLPEKK